MNNIEYCRFCETPNYLQYHIACDLGAYFTVQALMPSTSSYSGASGGNREWMGPSNIQRGGRIGLREFLTQFSATSRYI